MIRYILDVKNKELELLSGGSMEEFRDLIEKFKGYTIKISPKTNGGKSLIVKGTSEFLIDKIEHN